MAHPLQALLSSLQQCVAQVGALVSIALQKKKAVYLIVLVFLFFFYQQSSFPEGLLLSVLGVYLSLHIIAKSRNKIIIPMN
jgi:hypothetical protein